METEVDFRTATFSSSLRMVSLCLSMKAVPKSLPMVKPLNTVSSALVSKLPIMICSAALPLVLSQSFDADKSDGCASFGILRTNQWR